MIRVRFAVIGFSFLFIGSASYAADYPSQLFGISETHIDSVRRPHGPLEDRNVQQIVAAVATYMGVAPVYIGVAGSLLPTYRYEGEESFYDLPTPSGYAMCAIRIGVRSIIPSAGSQAPSIDVNATELGASVYTVTPNPGLGQGQSSVEADVQVTGILPQYLAEFTNKGYANLLRILLCTVRETRAMWWNTEVFSRPVLQVLD